MRPVEAIKREMEKVKSELVEVACSDIIKYREQVARYNTLKQCLDILVKDEEK